MLSASLCSKIQKCVDPVHVWCCPASHEMSICPCEAFGSGYLGLALAVLYSSTGCSACVAGLCSSLMYCLVLLVVKVCPQASAGCIKAQTQCGVVVRVLLHVNVQVMAYLKRFKVLSTGTQHSGSGAAHAAACGQRQAAGAAANDDSDQGASSSEDQVGRRCSSPATRLCTVLVTSAGAVSILPKTSCGYEGCPACGSSACGLCRWC